MEAASPLVLAGSRRYEISDEQYARIEPLLSGKPGDPGRNAKDNRSNL